MSPAWCLGQSLRSSLSRSTILPSGPALLDQARHGVAAFAAAFRASDLEQVDLADQIAEGDGAVAGQGISFDLTAELLGREGGHVG